MVGRVLQSDCTVQYGRFRKLAGIGGCGCVDKVDTGGWSGEAVMVRGLDEVIAGVAGPAGWWPWEGEDGVMRGRIVPLVG